MNFIEILGFAVLAFSFFYVLSLDKKDSEEGIEKSYTQNRFRPHTPFDLKKFIDDKFNTEFAYREELQGYMAVQSTLIVREAQRHKWDKALQLASKTYNRFVNEFEKYRGKSLATHSLLREYIDVSKKGVLDFETEMCFNNKDIVSGFESLFDKHMERKIATHTNKKSDSDDELAWLNSGFTSNTITHYSNKK